MAKEYADAEFLEYVVKALVDEPDKVEVDRKVDEMGVLLTSPRPMDFGLRARAASDVKAAVRSLLRVVGMKNNARVNLKIEEPEGGRGPARERTTDVDQALEDLKL